MFKTWKKRVFKVNDLANFVTERYKEIEPNNELENDELIRSESSCRADLIRWGAKWDHNKNRPYFEGHEREDVVIEREKFIDYFYQNKSLYYTVTPGPFFPWVTPIRTENKQTVQTHKIRFLLANQLLSQVKYKVVVGFSQKMHHYLVKVEEEV